MTPQEASEYNARINNMQMVWYLDFVRHSLDMNACISMGMISVLRRRWTTFYVYSGKKKKTILCWLVRSDHSAIADVCLQRIK